MVKNEIVKYIKNRLPDQLLALLIERTYEKIEHAIIRRVVFDIVLNDLNLVGGREVTVNGDDLIIKRVLEGEILVEVPAKLRHYSHIMSVNFVEGGGNTGHRGAYGHVEYTSGRGPLASLTDEFRKVNPLYTIATAIGNDFILIKRDGITPDHIRNSAISMQVAFSEAFEGFSTQYIPSFGNIALVATKMLLYKERFSVFEKYSNTQMSNALMQELLKFEDSADKYEELRSDLAKMAFATDPSKMTRLIQHMAGIYTSPQKNTI